MKHLLLIIAVLTAAAQAAAGIIPVRVTGSRVNLRAKPGTDYEVVTQANRDDVLLAKTFQTDWVEVLPPTGTKAYVYKTMIKDNLVAVDELNVRSGPGVNYSAIGRLKRNMVVVVREPFGEEWLEIEAPADCSLWISADYVEPVRPLGRPLNPVDEPLPVPALPVPEQDVAAPATPDPEPENSREYRLPGTVTLVPLDGQGRRGECAGELRKTPLLERRTFRFRLVEVHDNHVKTISYLYGNEPQLNRLLGKHMTVRGPEFWVRECEEPIFIPEEIVLATPKE